MDNIIDGKSLRDRILDFLKKEVETKKLKPHLVIIQVGDNEASNRYIKQKILAGEKIGAMVEVANFPMETTQKEIKSKIYQLNSDKKVTGIIVQLPLPGKLEETKLVQLVDPKKDVDGLTENSVFEPATPSGVMTILKEYKVPFKGRTAVVLGRSHLVGEPIKRMLETAGTKVIQIHSQTPKPIDDLVLQGDIVISAVGRPNLVTGSMIKKGAVVIDVGLSSDPETGKLVGDVDFEEVVKKASVITPVPGGVGPMTVALLMSNLVKSATFDN